MNDGQDDELRDGTSDEARILREMIRHEDDLRDQRLSYLLTLNGFLFAALAFAWDVRDRGDWLVLVLAIVGFVVGLSAQAAQAISEAGVSNLRDKALQASPPIMGVTGRCTDTHKVGKWKNKLVPWSVLPYLLMIVWFVVVIVRFWP